MPFTATIKIKTVWGCIFIYFSKCLRERKVLINLNVYFWHPKSRSVCVLDSLKSRTRSVFLDFTDGPYYSAFFPSNLILKSWRTGRKCFQIYQFIYLSIYLVVCLFSIMLQFLVGRISSEWTEHSNTVSSLI